MLEMYANFSKEAKSEIPEALSCKLQEVSDISFGGSKAFKSSIPDLLFCQRSEFWVTGIFMCTPGSCQWEGYHGEIIDAKAFREA